MNLKHIQARHQIIAIVFLLYLLPLILLCAVPVFYAGINPEWISFPLGLFTACVGSLMIFSMLGNQTPAPEPEPVVAVAPPPPPEPIVIVDTTEKEMMAVLLQQREEEIASANCEVSQLQQQHTQLLDEVRYRNEEMQKLTQERDNFHHQYEHLKDEYDQYKERSLEQLEQEKQQAGLFHETIGTLRSTIDQKQEQIALLENKIHDLTYEIKTLLQLADMHSEPSEDTAPGAIAEGFVINEVAHAYQVDIRQQQEEKVSHSSLCIDQLKRCIDIAQKITGSHHLAAYNSRFRDLGMDSYSLDLRRLCDSLRSENSCTIFVFSPKENKLLFVNNQVKELLGWSPEKFQQDFGSIVQQGAKEWKEGLSQLNAHNQSHAHLLMKKKSGQDQLIQCQLGLIPTGIFRNNIIGVLYHIHHP